jgi:hypothetical protein
VAGRHHVCFDGYGLLVRGVAGHAAEWLDAQRVNASLGEAGTRPPLARGAGVERTASPARGWDGPDGWFRSGIVSTDGMVTFH